jgi:hypothetical protein
VVPDFLAEAEQAYVLEYASKGEASGPDTIRVREVIGAVTEPLSIAYRVTQARADRYGLAGGGALEDRAGRSIRVFEGLVLPLPAERIASVGLTVQDLDAVTELTGPAFRKLWAAETRIDAEPSTAIAVGNSAQGARLLQVQVAEPYVIPGSTAGRRASHRPPPRDRGAPPSGRDRPGATVRARARRLRTVAAAVIVCVLAGLAAWYLTRPSPPSPPPPVPVSAQAYVRQWCDDLSSGKADDAYREFANSYRHSTTLADFESRLLGPGTTATCTSAATKADQAILSLRRADGQLRTVDLDLQDQSGQFQITAMTVSP